LPEIIFHKKVQFLMIEL